MAALQGLPRPVLQRMLNTPVSEANVGASIGDAMSINVLMRILPGALACAGLLTSDRAAKLDIWKKAARTPGMMPDALYCATGCADRVS